MVDDAEYTRQTSRAPQRVAWVLWSASMPYAVGRGAYMCGAEGLSLALACAERCYGAAALGLLCLLGSGEIDGAELLLVAHDVVLKGEEQTLGVLGGENLAAVDTCLGDTGEGSNEIDDELLVAVIDDGKVAVGAVGNLGGEFNLQLLLLGLFLFFHDV